MAEAGQEVRKRLAVQLEQLPVGHPRRLETARHGRHTELAARALNRGDMDKQLVNYFLEEAAKAFAFVVTEHSFAAPRLEVNDEINFAFVTFMGTHLAIECSLDEREGDVACTIARVIDGKRATHRDAIDERDEHGARVREYLSKLLERRGVRERLFTLIGGGTLRERIQITLADFARMLSKHGREVLNDSPTVLA